MFFLIAVGIGPFAGVLAVYVSSVGIFGNLFADTIEEINKAITEGMDAAGASWPQIVQYGVWAQVKPSFIANTFYAFDVNLRVSIILGVFGGGGLGLQPELASRVLRYHDMLAYALFVIVLITLMERISDYPVSVKPVGDLLDRHAQAGIELRIVPNLWSLRDAVVESGLDFSLIRMRNAKAA